MLHEKKYFIFKILFILVPCILFLLFVEIVLRMILAHHIVYDVEMSRYALSLKMNSLNPLIGHVHQPNKEMNLMNVSVCINSDGFRDQEYSLMKSKKKPLRNRDSLEHIVANFSQENGVNYLSLTAPFHDAASAGHLCFLQAEQK